MTHAFTIATLLAASEDELSFPEAESAMLFEGSHSADGPLIIKVRHLPLDRLFHLRATRMHDLAQMFQNRFGKLCRLVDVRVHSPVFFSHGRQ